MNSQQMMEEIDRLTRLCKEKNAENYDLRKSLIESDAALKESRNNDMESMRQLSEAQAQIAMQAEVLKVVDEYLTARVSNSGVTGRTVVLPKVKEALSATSETVAAWRAKETEPLRREVAMLRDYVKESLPVCGQCDKETVGVYYYHDEDGDEHCCEECHKAKRNFFTYGGKKDEFVLYGIELLNNTKATALAYEREVVSKARIAALEGAIGFAGDYSDRRGNIYSSDYLSLLRGLIEQERANKGEVK